MTPDDHLRMARSYAEMAEAATRLDVADGRTALASMHYLAYLAEMVAFDDSMAPGHIRLERRIPR